MSIAKGDRVKFFWSQGQGDGEVISNPDNGKVLVAVDPRPYQSAADPLARLPADGPHQVIWCNTTWLWKPGEDKPGPERSNEVPF